MKPTFSYDELVRMGFTGDIFNGHYVFVRKDYEEVNSSVDESDRLARVLGYMYGDMLEMMNNASIEDESLLYRCSDPTIDSRLRYEAGDLWVPYKDGYVHTITGEYRFGLKPQEDEDSFPCWTKRPVNYNADKPSFSKTLAKFCAFMIMMEELKKLKENS